MKENDPVALAEAIHDEPIDASLIESARQRVASRLSEDAGTHDTIEGCADFARLIPAFVAGQLPEPRRLLVQDHTRSCVPCRRVLMAARSVETAAPAAARRRAPAPIASALRYAALAASIALAFGGGLWFTLRDRPLPGEMARIQSVEGMLLVPSGATMRPVAAGGSVTASNVLRTGRTSRAVLRLADGSRVEMGARSELRVTGRSDGLTVHLDRGQVIVEAAKQKAGKHLWIKTSDCDVAVVGTVFTVAHGARGSRVSVLEGEVQVSSGSRKQSLRPGDQTSTAPGEAVPMRSEVAWSDRQEHYLALLGEIDNLARELNRALPAPGVRHGTRLLDVAPAASVVYAAMPNRAGDLLPSYRLVLAKVEQGGVLAEHLGPALGSADARAHVEQALTLLGELGEQLGDEIALVMTHDGTRMVGPLLYAEARRPRELADFLPGFVARVNGAAGKPVLRLSGDTAATEGSSLVLSREGDFLAIAAGEAPLEAFRASVAGASAAATPFHARLAQVYQEGVYQLFAVDLANVMARVPEGGHATLERLGFADADTLLVTRTVTGETSTSRAVLGFGHERRGVASWLAEPAPMGSLDFISPNAAFAAAVVVKEPAAIADELFAALRAGEPEFDVKLANVQQELGIDLRNDLAASLGGELAIAVDGPLLPKPAIEVIAEVYDAGRLQAALQRLAAKADAKLRAEGQPGLILTSTVVSGRTYHALALEGADPWLHWTYEDGFLVAAPARVLVDRALQTRATGATLRRAPEFLSRLPGSGPLDVSALVWQNLGSVLKTQSPPSLGYAWGEKDRVVFSATGDVGTLGGLPMPMLMSLSKQRAGS